MKAAGTSPNPAAGEIWSEGPLAGGRRADSDGKRAGEPGRGARPPQPHDQFRPSPLSREREHALAREAPGHQVLRDLGDLSPRPLQGDMWDELPRRHQVG